MGTQNRHARMPLSPEHVAARPYPILWDTRAKVMANDRRKMRDVIAALSGADLTRVLDEVRRHVADNYIALVVYRAALNEAVISRHWTVSYSALTGTHEIR